MRLFPVGPKIYPKINDNNAPKDLKIGNEVRKTEESKKNLQGFNNKFTGYKDASQLTRLRASMSVSKQMEDTDNNKKISNSYVNDAIRRNRNSGATVPRKVTHKNIH